MKEQFKKIMEDILDKKIHKLEGLTQFTKLKYTDEEKAKEALKELAKSDFIDKFGEIADILSPYIIGDKEDEYFKYLINKGEEEFLIEVLMRNKNIVTRDNAEYKINEFKKRLDIF